jgi:hypothetical protein
LVAAMFKEKINPKWTMLAIDGVVFITGIFVIGPNNLYSIIVLIVTPFVVGKVLSIKKGDPEFEPKPVILLKNRNLASTVTTDV